MKSCCKEAFEEDDDDKELKENDSKQSSFEKLRNKWQAKNMLQLALILCTFAIGGFGCSFLGRWIMHYIGPNHKGLWLLVYIVLVTILWPLSVLTVSIPLGQLPFFRKYLSKLGAKILGKKPQ